MAHFPSFRLPGSLAHESLTTPLLNPNARTSSFTSQADGTGEISGALTQPTVTNKKQIAAPKKNERRVHIDTSYPETNGMKKLGKAFFNLSERLTSHRAENEPQIASELLLDRDVSVPGILFLRRDLKPNRINRQTLLLLAHSKNEAVATAAVNALNKRYPLSQ